MENIRTSRRGLLRLGLATVALAASPARAQSTPMQIQVKAATGTTYTLDVDSADTVESVKQQIQNRTGTPTSQQVLTFAGKQLEDGVALSEYGIVAHSVLTLTLRPAGG